MDDIARCVGYAQKMIALEKSTGGTAADIYINPEIDILSDLESLEAVASVEVLHNSGQRFYRAHLKGN